ncbi:MAG: hypothetical protein E7599_03920 [Ruminococcaceae bacterium]|nr:hypothetical protein [Oscillospiraceae bacterium]
MNQKLYSALYKAEDYICEYNYIDGCIQDKEEELEDYKEKIECWRKSAYEKGCVTGCLVLPLFVVSILFGLPCAALIFDYYYFGIIGVNVEAIDALSIMVIVSGAILGIGLFLKFVFGRLDKKEINEFEIRYQNEYKPKVDKLESEIPQLKEKLLAIYQEKAHLCEVLPYRYRNYDAVHYMLTVVEEGRAHTLEQAIDMYDVYAHRMRLEKTALGITRMQGRIARNLDSIQNEQTDLNDRLRSIEHKLDRNE